MSFVVVVSQNLSYVSKKNGIELTLESQYLRD